MFGCKTCSPLRLRAFQSRSLHSDREQIPDVAAVYFVMPTKENIERIARVSLAGVTSFEVGADAQPLVLALSFGYQDCRDGLYDTFYINFVSSLSRNLLEELASLTVQYNASNRVRLTRPCRCLPYPVCFSQPTLFFFFVSPLSSQIVDFKTL